ncbi:hypothetical protein OKW38_004653 [Paraburkholderia sp. MM5496-R1]
MIFTTIVSISVTLASSIVASCAPFARAHVDQVRDRLLAASEHRIAQRLGRDAAFGEHARPAQNFAGAQTAGFRKRAEHRAFQLRELRERVAVDRARVRRLLAALQIHANVDLAARQLVHQHLAQRRFDDAHVFRHAEVQIEKARVHRAQFDRHADATRARGCHEFARGARIASHAVDHRISRDWGHAVDDGLRSGSPGVYETRGGESALSHFCRSHPYGQPPYPIGGKIRVFPPPSSSPSRPIPT